MKNMFIIEKGVLKKQKGFFIDHVSMKITLCIAIVAGLAFILVGFMSYVGKILEVLGYVSR